MLLAILLSIPPAAPDATQTGIVDLATLTPAAAARLAGQPHRFRVVIDSLPDVQDDGRKWLECESGKARASIMRSVMLAPDDESDTTVGNELIVRGFIVVIDQTDIRGRPFVELQVSGASSSSDD